MGRNGYRDGRQSDYGFNDGFDMNMDNEFFDGVQRDDYQYDGPGNDQPETDWQSKLLYHRFPIGL